MWPRLVFLQCLPTAKRWKWPTFPLGSGLPLGCVSPAESRSKITRPTLFPTYDQFLILLSKVINPPILEHHSLKENLVLLSQELFWLIQVALLKEMQWLGIFTQRLDFVWAQLERRVFVHWVQGLLQNNQSFLVDALISDILPFPQYKSINIYVISLFFSKWKWMKGLVDF